MTHISAELRLVTFLRFVIRLKFGLEVMMNLSGYLNLENHFLPVAFSLEEVMTTTLEEAAVALVLTSERSRIDTMFFSTRDLMAGIVDGWETAITITNVLQENRRRRRKLLSLFRTILNKKLPILIFELSGTTTVIKQLNLVKL